MVAPLAMVGAAVAALVAWIVARRFGVLAGLVLPGLVGAASLVATWWPVGHAEEVMGRGLATLFLWLPLVTFTWAGAGIGLIGRWKARRRG